MTSLDGVQTLKTRQMPPNKTALVAALDYRHQQDRLSDCAAEALCADAMLRGRTHSVELIGLSHIQSRGVKAGAVVDLNECEQAVRRGGAGRADGLGSVESVLLSVSAGRLQGSMVEASSELRGGGVTPADMSRVIIAGMHHATPPGRTVLHVLPATYSLDGVKGVRDPSGMVARHFGIDMNVMTADATAAKNLMLVVERCHLNVEAMAAGPYVSGLSVLTDDEADLGAAVVEMVGPRRLRPFRRAVRTPADLAVGGRMRRWIWRAVWVRIADAERIKTLYGTATGGSDARSYERADGKRS